MLFVYGLLTATAAIIAAEIAFNYGLGDKVKDLFLSEEARVKRDIAKVKALEVKLAGRVKAVFKR